LLVYEYISLLINICLDPSALHTPFGIRISTATFDDVVLIYNIFFTFIIILNILILLYANNKSFDFKIVDITLYKCFKNQYFYYFCLFSVILITCYEIYVQQTIIPYLLIEVMTGSSFPKADVINSFNFRF